MSSKNITPASLSSKERRLRSRLHQLLSQSEGLLHGSLIEMARRCGNPRCRCASDDACKHRSLYLGQTREGKTTMVYIPKDLEETVRRWAGDYQRASELLEQINQEGRAHLANLKAKGASARKAGKAAAGKKPTLKAGTKPRAKKKNVPRKPPSKPS